MPGERVVRPMAVESARRVLRAADPARPGIAVIRDNETMMRAVAVCVEDRRFEAQRPSLPASGPKRPKPSRAPCRQVANPVVTVR